MSHQRMLQRWLSFDGIDVTLAKVGVLACFLLFGLRLLTEQVLLVIIPTATMVACVVYLGIRRHTATTLEVPALPGAVRGYLPAVVIGGSALLTLSVYATGVRGWPTHLLTGAIGSAILAQTLLIDDDDLHPGVVLAQILVAAVVIRLAVLFSTPGYIGVDVWTHVPMYIEGIVEAESLSAIADNKYIMAPFYHTIGAIAALVFGSARVGLYLTVGITVPLSVLLVYSAGRLLVPVRWALVATALYAFADQFIRWGIHVIPTSLGLVFFLGALYCVTKLFHTDAPWVVGLLLVFSLATVFTHQVSTAIVLVLLGVGSVSVLVARPFGSDVVGRTAHGGFGLVVTFLITLAVTVVSWLNTPWFGEDPFLTQMLSIIEGTLASEAGFLNLVGGGGDTGGAAGDSAGGAVGLLGEIIPFIEWVGFALLLSAAVVGGLALLRMDNPPEVTLTYLFGASTMFIVVFGFSLFGIRDILPGRWMGFMYALMAIIAAVGLYHLSGSASRRVILVVFVIVALGYPATMVVAEKATMANPAFEDEHPRIAYTESEIAAVETIRTIYPPEADRRIYSDHPYQSMIGRYGGYSSSILEVDDSGVASPDAVVRRTYQTQGASTFHEPTDPPRAISSRTIEPDRVCSPRRNHVYENGMVTMCTTSPTVPEVSP